MSVTFHEQNPNWTTPADRKAGTATAGAGATNKLVLAQKMN